MGTKTNIQGHVPALWRWSLLSLHTVSVIFTTAGTLEINLCLVCVWEVWKWGCVLVRTSLNVQCHDLAHLWSDTILFCQTLDWCNFHVNTTCGGLWNKSCLKLIINYCNLQAWLISAAYLSTALFEMTLWHLGWIITMRNWLISRWIISFKCEHAMCFSVFDCHVHSPTVFSWFCSVICRNSKCSNSVFTTSRFLRSSIHTYSYLCMCNWRWSESITLRLLALMVTNIVF